MLKYKIEDYIGKKYGHLKVLGKAIESNVPNCFLFLCDSYSALFFTFGWVKKYAGQQRSAATAYKQTNKK